MRFSEAYTAYKMIAEKAFVVAAERLLKKGRRIESAIISNMNFVGDSGIRISILVFDDDGSSSTIKFIISSEAIDSVLDEQIKDLSELINLRRMEEDQKAYARIAQDEESEYDW